MIYVIVGFIIIVLAAIICIPSCSREKISHNEKMKYRKDHRHHYE